MLILNALEDIVDKIELGKITGVAFSKFIQRKSFWDFLRFTTFLSFIFFVYARVCVCVRARVCVKHSWPLNPSTYVS
jgi:hypothetical protein